MRSQKTMAIIILPLLLLIIPSIMPKTSQSASSTTPVDVLTRQFHRGLNQVDIALNDYLHLAERLKSSAEVAELQSAHLRTRLAYKKVEYLVAYLDASAVNKYINGAPLPKVEPHVPEINVIEPSGLQVLDEIIFAETAWQERETIIELIKKLQKNWHHIATLQRGVHLNHHKLFSAARQACVRVFTLGVTGFDTPGSAAALPEAREVLHSLEVFIQAYESIIAEVAPKELARLNDAILTGYRLLGDDDFDAFDRMAFLRETVDPLYGGLLRCQSALQIEFTAETTDLPQPVNEQASHLFSDGFLEVSYYTNTAASKHIKARQALGKLLFYDPLLSGDHKRACISCHHPDKAFTDGQAKSLATGKKGGTVLRNAPTLVNSVFAERYFYDLREPSLERQVKHVVMDSLEFNTDFHALTNIIAESETYSALFAEAYPDQPKYQISKWSISNALAAYVDNLHSFNSPVDQYARKEIDELPAPVIRGFNLFMGKAACGTCHFAPIFSGLVPPRYQESESEVLGVPVKPDTLLASLDPDPGRYASSRPEDQAPFYWFSFKTPTVRNAALTAPYMHNGVYKDLHQVVDFYNRGGGAGIGIDLEYQTLPPTPLNLSQSEMNDLVIFMEALSDTSGMTSPPSSLPKLENHPKWDDRKAILDQ